MDDSCNRLAVRHLVVLHLDMNLPKNENDLFSSSSWQDSRNVIGS